MSYKFFDNIPPLYLGIKQCDPKGYWFQHDKEKGWPINLIPFEGKDIHIWFQDDLTFFKNKFVELESYKEYYKDNIKNIFFYTWHEKIVDIYPNLNIIVFPKFLIDHWINILNNSDIIIKSFNFEKKSQKVLCLNGNHRKHRDIVFSKINNNKNIIYSYLAKKIKIPTEIKWSRNDYQNWHDVNDTITYTTYDKPQMVKSTSNDQKQQHLFRNTKNLLMAKDLYNSSCFSLVTETRYNLPCDFITEKTTQCWLALHPALYVSNRYHVAHVRDWGFDIFDDLFDHSYDLESDSNRIDTLFKNNQSQLNNGIILTDDVKQRLLKNREHYLKNFDKILLDHK
jgi:hypothetical protein